MEAGKGNVVMDGRDIGTYVLPLAKTKIFLTASEEERAKRRYLENLQAGKNTRFRK
jgi:cytidylate kinase